MNETDIPAAQPAAYQETWIPGADAYTVGSRGPQSTPQEGPQAVSRSVAVEARRALTDEGLPRSWRLNRTADIVAVLRSGQRRRTLWLDLAWRTNEEGHPRLGLVIPRHGATVVARNRLRRRLRELIRRRILPALSPVDLVVRSRASAYRAAFRKLATDLEEWQRSLTP